MDENDLANLDAEFKRYLQILRPYLEQLVHPNVIDICNSWIQRLSNCKDNEKTLRNKYVFALCFQVARGFLDGPFSKTPPVKELSPLTDELNGDDSSTEVEYAVVDSEEPVTSVLFANKKQSESETEDFSQDNECDGAKDPSRLGDSDTKLNYDKNTTNKTAESYVQSPTKTYGQDMNDTRLYAQSYAPNYCQDYTRNTAMHEQKVFCYTCPEMLMDYGYYSNTNSDYCDNRAVGLIKKLRDIKTQNRMLHQELIAIKGNSKTKPDDFGEEYRAKIDTSTSVYIVANDSNATLKSLKCRLQEVQESRNNLIETIGTLQDKLDNFNEIKKHEIDEIEAKHKLEIIQLKTSTREETKEIYEKKINELKKIYEGNLKEIQNKSILEINSKLASKDEIITEKNKVINAKDIEISRLRNQVEDQKINFHSVLSKLFENPVDDLNNDTTNIRIKAQHLEKRLNKLEKSKIKCAKAYEAKVASLQREKHLAECSLQLQLVRQRAQVVNEVTDENQAELATALNKLESKYKEIVANVQATAIQRRMQDQIALESILQATCGIQSDIQGTNGQLTSIERNQSRSYDSEVSNLRRENRVGNKSFGDDSVTTGYCLNGERMGELFERVHIPQRDNGEQLK